MKKRNRLLACLIWVLMLFLVLAGGWLLMFRLNQFSLVIQLKGDVHATTYQGEYWEDPGAEVKLVGTLVFRKGIDTNLQPDRSGHVDIAVPGNYEILYSASFYQWKASETRFVQVKDSTPPSISLMSVPGHYTVHGEAYQEEGYSAWDTADGDLTGQVVREEKDGFVIYSVEDRSGNRTTVARKIFYVDYTAPELKLLGEETVTVESGAGYTEPGWTAADNVDGDLSGSVEVTGMVDKYLAGSYDLVYTVRDASGNATETRRTVVVQPKELPETISPQGDVIYLTFDDGPGPYTEELLEVLEKYGAKATFFVVNTDYIHLAEEIVKKGHSIGIHCVEHDYQKLYESSDAFFGDLLSMQQIIYDETGVTTCLMRFPGGSSNTVSRFNEGIMTYLTQAVEDMGFQYFDWNVDSNDAGGAKKAEEVFNNVTRGVQNRRVSIVLQHDIKGFSVEAVEKILIWGKENGYQFLGLDMTSPTAHHGVNN